MSIKSVVIDDEELAQKSLAFFIEEHTPDVEILEFANSALTGINVINHNKPDLIFLDIEMSDGSGFDMLDSMDRIDFDVIFVTAHEEFALRAFKYEALDFLLKPVKPDELIRAVNRHRKRKTIEEKIEHRMGLVKSLSIMNSKIPLPDKDGIKFLEVGDVVRFEADGSYVTIHSLSDRPQLVSKPLKFYATMLSEEVFLRVHRSHLINVKFIVGFKREGGGYVQLSNGETVPVAEKKRDMVIRRLSTGN